MIGINDASLLEAELYSKEETTGMTGIEDQRIFHEPMNEHTSLFDAFQLLLNTAIGSGTLMVPYCYRSGVALSLFTSFIFATIGYFTLSFMAESGYFTHTYDYRGLFAHTFGKNRLWIINVMITCVQLGASMIYSLWNGRLTPKLLGTSGMKFPLGSIRFWTIVIPITFSVPLVCLKSIHILEKLAVLSTFTIILLIVHALYWMIVHIHQNGFDPNGQFRWVHFNAAAITSLSVNSMAYNCHMNLFAALEPMKMATVGRARKLAMTTVVSAYVLYNIFGIFTYFDLFDKIEGSSLECYESKNIFTKITLVGLIFMLILSVPIVVWAARNSVLNLIWKDQPPTTCRWITVGTIISVCAAGLAATSENVIIFFDIVGGFFTPTIIFFMPAIFYIRNQRNEPRWRIIVAWIIACFTVVSICISLYQTGKEIAAEFKKK